MVDLNGDAVDFEKHLKDIGKRHGEDSYRTCSETIRWLENRKSDPAS